MLNSDRFQIDADLEGLLIGASLALSCSDKFAFARIQGAFFEHLNRQVDFRTKKLVPYTEVRNFDNHYRGRLASLKQQYGR